jgi:hypothetical protein
VKPLRVIRSTYTDNAREPRRVYYWKTAALGVAFLMGVFACLILQSIIMEFLIP